VYGILHLLPKALASLIQPNYKLTVEEISEDFLGKSCALGSGVSAFLGWSLEAEILCILVDRLGESISMFSGLGNGMQMEQAVWIPLF
jgi:hypothetical protein